MITCSFFRSLFAAFDKLRPNGVVALFPFVVSLSNHEAGVGTIRIGISSIKH